MHDSHLKIKLELGLYQGVTLEQQELEAGMVDDIPMNESSAEEMRKMLVQPECLMDPHLY